MLRLHLVFLGFFVFVFNNFYSFSFIVPPAYVSTLLPERRRVLLRVSQPISWIRSLCHFGKSSLFDYVENIKGNQKRIKASFCFYAYATAECYRSWSHLSPIKPVRILAPYPRRPEDHKKIPIPSGSHSDQIPLPWPISDQYPINLPITWGQNS